MRFIIIGLLILGGLMTGNAQYCLSVDASRKGAPVQPEMYGVFFEDINFGADGGLYAELVKNRSFEFPQPATGWTFFGKVKVEKEAPCFSRNPHYVRVEADRELTGSGMENAGFRGIGVKQGADYRFSVYARVPDGKAVKLQLELVSSQNDPVGTAGVEISGSAWKKYTTVLRSQVTDARGRLRLTLQGEGIADMDHVSLFPVDTWKGRENGLRKDLVEALEGLKPGVFRFPGGCIVEGNSLVTRYRWKNSVGPVENRPLNENRWNYTFRHKLFPDYFQSYGLGFYEYFLLCEDLGAAALPVLNCGLSCQYESHEEVSLDSLDPYIQDAVDLVEFANGPVNSRWGKVRAEMGHPGPFGLRMIAIGNEQWGPQYVERLERFMSVMREKCPGIRIVGSAGPQSDGKEFDYLWPEMKRLKVDLVDEHYYRSPQWFLENAGRYDRYDRKGPKVFAGEYAAHPDSRENNWEAALAEAAFMTGLERNADVVWLATYAPLFAHTEAWQWRPDLIWFDNLHRVLTPNYYVQQLYATNAGTHTVPALAGREPLTGQDNLYASAVWDEKMPGLIVKVVNVSPEVKSLLISVKLPRYTEPSGEWEILCLQSDDLQRCNRLKEPLQLVPAKTMLPYSKEDSPMEIPGYSFTVYRLKCNKN